MCKEPKFRQEIPDPQIKDAAEQFKAAADILIENPPGSGIVLPLINVSAMAIELYLKCLAAQNIYTPESDTELSGYIVTSKPMEGSHKLVSLFNQINKQIKSKIEKEYANNFSEDNYKFVEMLASLENSFVESRYPFEQNSDITRYSIRDLKRVYRFLDKFVANIKPLERIK